MARFDTIDAVTTPTVTNAIMIVDSALISGLTPNRTDEKILIGNVVDAGPDVNDAITRSSNDRVKANNQPENTAGAMIGNVTDLNASHGVQPKSCAASSKLWSKLTNRDDTTTDT